ncbi:YjbQ family protein [Candidatus Woesearchaeota archaeon]|nr:YjbQ family protein [Candidatus Woesearchaeota archaeon]
MKELHISTKKRCELVDITRQVQDIVAESKIKEGICHIYCPHTTAAISINENSDENIETDLMNFLNHLVPHGKWLHDSVDGNGDAHIKANILGSDKSMPITDGKLLLGTWQSINFCEFDGPRDGRKVIVTILRALQSSRAY